MSDQPTPQDDAVEADRVTVPLPRREVVETVPVRLSATDVAFPWVWALVGLVVVVLAVVIALVTESQGIGLT